MRLKKFLLSILCTSLIFTCEKDMNPVSASLKQIPFPMKTGSTWVYDISDTTYYTFFGDSSIINDGILKVKILDSIILDNGKKALIWQYNFKNTPDSLYAVVSEDSIIFYRNRKYPFPKIILVFPLSVNKEWESSECDKYKVLGKETISLPGGKAIDVVNVEQNFTCEVEAWLVNNYYVNANIGIIKYQAVYSNAHYSESRHTIGLLKSFSISE